RRRRVIVAGRQRLRGGKTTDGEIGDGRFGATAQHHVGVAVLDHARAHTDRVQAGGAGGHDRLVGPLHAEHDRQVAGDHVDDRPRNEEGRNLAGTTAEEIVVRLLDHGQATDTGADIDADAVRVGLGYFDAGIANR